MKKSLILLSFLIILLSSCNDIRKTSLSGLIYGTTYNIQFYSSYSENYFFEIDSIFNEIDDSMSTYKSNSLITKINTNQTVLLDNHFKNVFNTSKKIFELYDVNVVSINKMIEDLESQKNLENSLENYQNLLKLNNIIEKKFQKHVKNLSNKTKENIIEITSKKNAKRIK